MPETNFPVNGAGFNIEKTYYVDFIGEVVIKNLRGINGGAIYMKFDPRANQFYKL